MHAVQQLCASGKLRCSEKTRRPTAATVTAVAEVLSAGDFYPNDAITAFAWPLLIHAGGWAEQAGNRLQLTSRGRAALSAPAADTVRQLWRRWVSHGLVTARGLCCPGVGVMTTRSQDQFLERVRAAPAIDLLRSVLEEGSVTEPRGSKASQLAERFVAEVLDRGVGGFGPWKGAVVVAQEHLRAAGDPEAAIRRLVRTHVRLAASSGFVTGLGGLAAMAITVPAGVTGLYIVAARMVAGIAHLRGHDVGSEEIRSTVLVCLLGSAGAEVLKRSGVEVGTRSAAAALRKLPGQILIEINKRVGYRLVTKFGQRGVINLGKLVPVVGGPIGATIDGASCRSIATYALTVFPPAWGSAGSPRVIEADTAKP